MPIDRCLAIDIIWPVSQLCVHLFASIKDIKSGKPMGQALLQMFHPQWNWYGNHMSAVAINIAISWPASVHKEDTFHRRVKLPSSVTGRLLLFVNTPSQGSVQRRTSVASVCYCSVISRLLCKETIRKEMSFQLSPNFGGKTASNVQFWQTTRCILRACVLVVYIANFWKNEQVGRSQYDTKKICRISKTLFQ